MLTIDGSQGEGGGQMLRTSLALSLLTGTPFRMVSVRARRPKPGLMRQHLTALEAAVTVSRAEVSGAAVGSTELTFRPGRARGGDYAFSVGTAGSATLVLQAILPALMLADAPSSLVLEGGTHNPHAPPFDFLARAFLPLLRRMGPRIDAVLELQVIAERLGWERAQLHSETVSDARGPGNVVIVELESEHVTELFTSFGERGVPAEAVAERAAHEAVEYLASDVPVATHLEHRSVSRPCCDDRGLPATGGLVGPHPRRATSAPPVLPRRAPASVSPSLVSLRVVNLFGALRTSSSSRSPSPAAVSFAPPSPRSTRGPRRG